jgi:hypothetical protein
MTRPPGRRGGGGRGPKVRGGGGRRGGGGSKHSGCLVLALVGSGLMVGSGLVGILTVVTR